MRAPSGRGRLDIQTGVTYQSAMKIAAWHFLMPGCLIARKAKK